MCDKFYDVYDVVKEKYGDQFKYISMINLYIELYNEKVEEIMAKQVKLQVNHAVLLLLIENERYG